MLSARIEAEEALRRQRDNGALRQSSGRGKEEKRNCLVYVVEEGPTDLAEGFYMGHKENSSWKFLDFSLGNCEEGDTL